MDLKKRIGTFINQILIQYGIRQKDLSKTLGIGLASLSAYLKSKELPRADVLLKLAEIGGVTMDELLKTDKSPQKKEISIKISAGDHSQIGGGIVHGDVYQNTTVKKIYKYTYQPGDLTEEQAARLQLLVDDIVNLEKTVKRSPKSHAAVWNALKRKFKVAYYRKIGEEDFQKAELYLMMWRGRLTKPSRKKTPDSYRKRRYASIFSRAKNQLGWTKEEVDNFIFAQYGVSSIRNLSDDQLERLYSKIMGKK
jgi:transcriptional regulator with XRE-family HTH domain